MSVSMIISSKINNFEIHFETLLAKLSLWGASMSVVFAIFAICFLAYNRRKFLRHNPDWGNFDLKKKFDLEMSEKK